MGIPEGDLDLLAIGETLVDFISIEETDWLRNAYTFRKYQGDRQPTLPSTLPDWGAGGGHPQDRDRGNGPVLSRPDCRDH
jgi:hypothetical protein